MYAYTDVYFVDVIDLWPPAGHPQGCPKDRGEWPEDVDRHRGVQERNAALPSEPAGLLPCCHGQN